MKAAFIQTLGPSSVIEYGDLPTPAMGPDDVLVKVAAVTVDQVDTLIRAGFVKTQLAFPFIIGRDMTGQVVDKGKNVTRFQVGQWVWCNNQGYDGRQGTFAEYCAVQEDFLYPLPAGADPIESVATFHSALTAIVGLLFKARLRSGESVFVNGGDGSVGTVVLQIAKQLGARVAVTSANEEKAAWCRSLGADAVIDYRAEDVGAAIRRFAPNGVDIYWDSTAKLDARRAVDAVGQRGRIIVITGPRHETTLPVQPFFLKDCTLFGFTVTGATKDELATAASHINQWRLRAKIARRLPLSSAAEAHRLSEEGGLFGKVILQP